MSQTAQRWLGPSLAVAVAAALSVGCTGEAPLGPDRRPVDAVLRAAPRIESRAPDLGTCENLQPPAGSKLAFHVYAEGVQIYRWNGTTWTFVAPSAELFADAGGRGLVGTHYAGPTWESLSGSTVVGAVLERCTPDPTAIPWLLLSAVSADGPGVFERVTFIQRVNITGGAAPSGPGSLVGEVTEVPYTAEYFFYRAQ